MATFLLFLSAGLLYVHSGMFHEKSPGKRCQFFLLLDKKENDHYTIDVADRLSIERGAADVQVRVR